MTQRALINHDVLQWARVRAGLEPETVAHGITSDFRQLLKWENGVDHPTIAQARKLASRLRVPFGFLFLSEPPEETLPIPDLRTRSDRTPERISPDLIDQIEITLAKQQWYRQYMLSIGAEPLPFVGSLSIESDIRFAANQIRTALDLESIQFQAGSWSAFLTSFVQSVESNDILVMRSGIVGNNSTRRLNPEEFQGFAVADPIAPLIFINSKDFVAAKIFTLAHELAHIWIGESGITLIDAADIDLRNHQIETWCNNVAAEALVPTQSFRSAWSPQSDLADETQRLARLFRVSTIVVLRRAFELELISRDQFFHQLSYEREHQLTQPAGGRGHQINNIIARSGRKFTNAIVNATLEGSLGYATASQLLGVKTKTIGSLADHLGL